MHVRVLNSNGLTVPFSRGVNYDRGYLKVC